MEEIQCSKLPGFIGIRDLSENSGETPFKSETWVEVEVSQSGKKIDYVPLLMVAQAMILEENGNTRQQEKVNRVLHHRKLTNVLQSKTWTPW